MMKVVEAYVHNSFRCLSDSKIETKENLVDFLVTHHEKNKLVLCKNGATYEAEMPKKRKVVRGKREIDNELIKILDLIQDKFTYKALNNADTQIILRIDELFGTIVSMNAKFINTRQKQSKGGKIGAAKRKIAQVKAAKPAVTKDKDAKNKKKTKPRSKNSAHNRIDPK